MAAADLDLVPAAARTLDLLEAFRTARRPLSLSALARLAGIPVSTCHGLLRTLERRGFLYYPSQNETYPTRRLYDLARDIDAHDPIGERLAPLLARLRDDTGETVILGLRDDDAVLYLRVLEGPQVIRYTARAGERKPLHSSSIGKALLGSMPEAALNAWLAGRTLPRITDRTITSAAKLKRDLAAARARGTYVTSGENVADVMAIAAPLSIGSAALGVAVAGPLHRMTGAHQRHARKLLDTVRAARGTPDGR